MKVRKPSHIFHLKIVNFYSFKSCCILNRFVKVMPILGIFFSGGIIGVVLGCLALLLSVFAVTIVLFRSRFEGFLYCLILSLHHGNLKMTPSNLYLYS